MRFDSSDNDDAADQVHVPYVLFVELDFASGFVRLNSTDRTYQHEGNDYTGTGRLAGISPVRENGDLIPEKLEFTLSGVDPSTITTTLTEDYHGRSVKVWLAFVDENRNLIDTPELLWEGEMDVMSIQRDHGSAIVSLVCENRLIRWNETAGWMYTKEHQQLFDPNDKFLNFVTTLPNKQIRWGGSRVQTGTSRERGPGSRYRNEVER